MLEKKACERFMGCYWWLRLQCGLMVRATVVVEWVAVLWPCGDVGRKWRINVTGCLSSIRSDVALQWWSATEIETHGEDCEKGQQWRHCVSDFFYYFGFSYFYFIMCHVFILLPHLIPKTYGDETTNIN